MAAGEGQGLRGLNPADASLAETRCPSARVGPGWPGGAPDLGFSPWQVCARTMGASLGSGARVALLPRQACGAVRRWAPPAPARGCHSKTGLPRPVPLKKRGYDVTRNPHLNKVTVPEGGMAQAAIQRRPEGAPPPGPGKDPPSRPSSGFPFLPGEACSNSVWLVFLVFLPLFFNHSSSPWKEVISNAGSPISSYRRG